MVYVIIAYTNWSIYMDLFKFAAQFKTDISAIEITSLTKAKCWAEIEQCYPESKIIEVEIASWLSINTPTLFQIVNLASQKKRYDLDLMAVIKTCISYGQNKFEGLRPSDMDRIHSLFYKVNQLLLKHLEKAFKNHGLLDELCTQRNHRPDYLFSFMGKKPEDLPWLFETALPMQPDSKYLNLAKVLNEESVKIRELYNEIDVIDFHPKKRSEYHRCSCCFRWVRLKPSNPDQIAYHGYTIDRYGYNDISSDSCNGSKYKPLEVSAEGTLKTLEANFNGYHLLKNQLKESTDDLTNDEIKHKRSIKNRMSSITDYSQFALEMIRKYQPQEIQNAKIYIL